MTHNLQPAGRAAVSGARGETAMIDRVLDALLALGADEGLTGPLAFPGGEPRLWSGIEIKHAEPATNGEVGGEQAGGEVPAAPAGPAPEPAPTLAAESTKRMLAQMRAVLDREAARLGADGAEGKAAVDQVSLIARTLEKIDQMERLIAEDQARAATRTLSGEERAELRETVRQLILAAAERMAADRAVEQTALSEGACDEGRVETSGGEISGEDLSVRAEAETR